MTITPEIRALAAEALGTGTLVAAVVGSGIMATDLTNDIGLALLINAASVVAALGILIWLLAPASGAHLNPGVTLAAAARGDLSPRRAAAYIGAQCGGALLGVALADIMFSLPAWSTSTTDRTGIGVWIGEVVATAGLIWIIRALGGRSHGHLAPLLVPAWIGAAYFFTSSTSFANPAVTLGRMLTDTFTGVAPASVLPFVAAQLLGAGVGLMLAALTDPAPPPSPPDPVERVEAITTGGAGAVTDRP